MDFFKKYSNWFFIVLVVLFLGASMKTCSRGRKITKLENQIEMIEHRNDSICKVKDDSIIVLNQAIQILQTEKKGYESNIALQNAALNQISEAKKNINVTVKRK